MGCMEENTEGPRNGQSGMQGVAGGLWVGRAADPTNEPLKADMRGVGTYAQSSQLLKSSGFDIADQISGSRNQREAGGSANPCIRRPMTKSSRSRKASLLMSFDGKTDNEVAALIRKTGDGFLLSQEWKKLRARVIDTYGGRCMCCGSVPVRGVNVDHIKPRKFYPDLALEFDNLQVLCNRCNKAKGNKHCTDYRHTSVPPP